MLKWMTGRKTYLLALIGVLSGIVLIVEGQTAEGLKVIWASLTAAAVRAGIAKAGNGN